MKENGADPEDASKPEKDDDDDCFLTKLFSIFNLLIHWWSVKCLQTLHVTKREQLWQIQDSQTGRGSFDSLNTFLSTKFTFISWALAVRCSEE